MATLGIRLLGGLSLEFEGITMPPIASRKARSLFGFVISQRHTTLSRDLLAGTFWPERPEARARRRLSHALWQIHQVLGESGADPYLILEADTVRFNEQTAYWIDVDRFEQLRSGPLPDMEAAIALYRGDFMAGSYDDWLLVEQQRLRDEYGALLQDVSDGHKGLGDTPSALVYAKRLAAHDPLREEAHREVMRLSMLLGQYNDAIRQFDFCSSILDEELGAHPAAETQALFDSIVEQRAKGDRPFVPEPSSPLFVPDAVGLVGRVEERAAAIERMTTAFSGRGGVVLVEGNLGVGVSHFLSGLADDAHWRGLGVIRGAARQPGEPYGLCRRAFGEALSPLRTQQIVSSVAPVWRSAVSGLFPDFAPAGVPQATRLEPNQESERIAQALTEILFAFGQINPHVVLLDDLHLADVETMTFLRAATRRLADSSVLLVLGYHSAEARDTPAVWEALLDIDTQPGVTRLALQDLNEVETAELVRMATGRPAASDLLDSLMLQTGGNPLLVLEALRTIAHLHQRDGAPPLTELASELLTRRVLSSPPETQRVLQAVAILTEPAALDGVIEVSDLDRPVVLAAIDDALRRALLVERGQQVEFSHSQLKTATLATIQGENLESMHRMAANHMNREHPDRAAELAHHLRSGGQFLAAAARYELAATKARAVFAFDTSAQHLSSALDAYAAADVDDHEIVDTLLQYESALDLLGRRQEQEVVLGRLSMATRGRSDQFEVARRRVLFLGAVDRYQEAEEVADEAQALAEERSVDLGGLLAARGLVLAWSGRPADALPYLRDAVTNVERDPLDVAESRYALGMALSSLDMEEASEELDQALEFFRGSFSLHRVADILGLTATNSASRGDTPSAESLLQEAIDICHEIGFTQGAAVHQSNLAVLRYLDGRPAEALRQFDAALELLTIVPDARRQANVLSNAAFVRHRIMGDDATAAEAATAALDYYTAVDNPRGIAQVVAILASIKSRRDPQAALAYIGERFNNVASYGPWSATYIERRLAELHLAAGQVAEAAHHCDEARRWAVKGDLTDALASADGVAARVHLAAGDRESALDAARRSTANLSRAVEQPYLLHFGLYQAASDEAEREAALSAAFHSLSAVLDQITPAERLHAEAVPEHQAILVAWGTRHPVRHTIAVPGAADGVSLTIHSPEDRGIDGKRARRQQRVRRLLREASEQGVQLSTSQLSGLLQVSAATVRRDLATIREEDAAADPN